MRWSQISLLETLIVLIIAFVIWLITIFQLLKKKALKEFLLRITLISIAIICLVFIILKPQYTIEKSNSSAILFTENIKDFSDSIPAYVLPGISNIKNGIQIFDLADFERNNPNIHTLYIKGNGLEPEQLNHIKKVNIKFLENKPNNGFTSFNYTRSINEGDELVVNGNYFNQAKDSVKIILTTPEGDQDSVKIPNGEHNFSLIGHPTLPGNYVGSIKVKIKENVRIEPLPYIVEKKKPLHFIILQDYPSFEFNSLKDWLVKQKHHIQVKTRISKEKYNFQQINLSAEELKNPILSKENFETTDLIITDPESLKKLNLDERSKIKMAISNGLGVLVLPEADLAKSTEILDHHFNLISSEKKQFQLKENNKIFLKKLPFLFQENTLLIPLIESKDNEIIAAYIPDINGKIGLQLANETFTLLLEGEVKMYDQYWTSVIQSLTRKHNTSVLNIKDSPFLWKNNFSEIQFHENNNYKTEIIYQSGFKEFIQAKRELPDFTKLIVPFRAQELNWIKIKTGENGSVEDHFYIMPNNAWLDLKKSIWWIKYQKIIKKNSFPVPLKSNRLEDIPLIWFFIPLIFSLGFLWWRERIVFLN